MKSSTQSENGQLVITAVSDNNSTCAFETSSSIILGTFSDGCSIIIASAPTNNNTAE